MKLYKDLVVTGLSKNGIFFKNFQGEERTFNAKGKRNFQIRLDDPNAVYKYGTPGMEEVFDVSNSDILNGFVQLLQADGWHIKIEPATEQWPGRISMKVNVMFRDPNPMIPGDNGSAPEIYMINPSNQAIPVGKDFMSTLDRNLIDYADIHLTPYNYNEKEGKNDQSAYLRHMYFRFAVTDPFANKYGTANGSVMPDPAAFEAPSENDDEEMPFE